MIKLTIKHALPPIVGFFEGDFLILVEFLGAANGSVENPGWSASVLKTEMYYFWLRVFTFTYQTFFRRENWVELPKQDRSKDFGKEVGTSEKSSKVERHPGKIYCMFQMTKIIRLIKLNLV